MNAWPPFVLLEDRLAGTGEAWLYRDPVRIVRCDEADAVDDAFASLEAGLAEGLHAAGFFAYELGHVLEPRLRPHLAPARDMPLLWFGLFPPPRHVAGPVLDRLFASRGPPPPLAALTPAHDRAHHVGAVRRVLEWIAAGDIYQANLTFPFRFRYAGAPLALYAALRASQPVAHGGIVAMGDRTVLSVSPELFVRIAGDRAETRPMKGTARRGADAADDARQVADLVADPKQRAENLMIVDLLRNDLARISEPGSVATTALFTPESYPSFHALTSTISSRLRPGTGLRERIAALFPCGSVVGAPKIRAADIIAKIESGPRGVYTGAIGAVAPGGDLRFNVAIRTAVVSASGAGRYDVGGGIVAASDPDAEYDEALLKARVLTDLAAPYDLVETLRWTPGTGFLRLDVHLARLARSAAALGFACDLPGLLARLLAEARRWPRQGDRRVRIAVARNGVVAIAAAALTPLPSRPTLVIARERLDAADPFLRHKTSRRGAYEAAHAEAQRAGRDEALLLNHRGHLADGSRTSVFVSIGGRLLTPRLDDGALPGILRAAMIAARNAVPATVTPDMLAAADAVMIGNSLHGLRTGCFE